MRKFLEPILISAFGSIVISIIAVVLYISFVAPIQCSGDHNMGGFEGFSCSLTGIAIFLFTILISFLGLLIPLLARSKVIQVEGEHKYRKIFKIFIIAFLFVILLLVSSLFI